jgi:hypothetical protein
MPSRRSVHSRPADFGVLCTQPQGSKMKTSGRGPVRRVFRRFALTGLTLSLFLVAIKRLLNRLDRTVSHRLRDLMLV